MDNAIDVEAARTKGITSLVAGHADILIVPNLEAGNMLAKELVFVAHAEAAGLAVGRDRADHPDQPCRQRKGAACLLRHRGF